MDTREGQFQDLMMNSVTLQTAALYLSVSISIYIYISI